MKKKHIQKLLMSVIFLCTAKLVVADDMYINPAIETIQQDATVMLEVVGGTEPFSWDTSAGIITGEGRRVSFQAPDVSQECQIIVTDAMGVEASSLVKVDSLIKASAFYVDADLPLDPHFEEIYLEPGQMFQIAATESVPPYSVIVEAGSCTTPNEVADAEYFDCTAPDMFGDYLIRVRSAVGDTTAIAVYVYSPLKVTPSIQYMERNEKTTFEVKGGVPPYAALIVDGNGDIEDSESKTGVFTFISDSVADHDIVLKFFDNFGQTVQSHAYVQMELRAAPSPIYVDASGTHKFHVSGGTGNYTIVTNGGFATIDADTGVGTWNAPRKLGEYDLTISDSSGQEVIIKGMLEPYNPIISPSVAYMRPGETRNFMVSMGVPPYDWAFEGGGPPYKRLDSSSTYISITAPQTTGTYRLMVEDAAGNIDPTTYSLPTATINVFQPLLISPSFYPVYKGESVAVRFDKSGGVGACDWQLADLQEVTRGDDFIVVRPRTDVELGHQYTVTCRDKNGDVAQSIIVVSDLPCDLDGTISIDEQEMQTCMDKFFNGERP